MPRVTKRHFTLFSRAFQRYASFYRIAGVTIELHHSDEQGGMAAIIVSEDLHRADVYLPTEWAEEPTRERLVSKARHEVIHLLLSRLSALGTRRYLGEKEFYEAEEELVIRLSDLLQIHPLDKRTK